MCFCIFKFLLPKKPLCSVFFLCFGLFLGIIYYIENLKTDIQKSPCQPLKKISVTTFINSFVSAYNSTAQDLAAKNPSEMTTFRPKLRIL